MGHGNTPPQLPEITDEAANTPRWVPLLGAILFVASVVAIVVCHGACGDEAAAPEAGEAAP
jgi:hypothetical protein